MLKRVLALLTAEERSKLLKVAASVFFTALLDFASLASLFPLLGFLLDGVDETKAILGFSLIALFLVCLKFFVSVQFGKYQGKFTLSLYKRLSFRLFSNYYNKGLLFIKEHGYSTLGHSVNFMCYSFSQGIISPMMRMFADALLIFLVTVALLVYDWKTVMVLYICFVPFMFAYILFVRNRLKSLAKADFDAKREQARIVADSFRGYQDLETNNAFGFMQKSFSEGLDTISGSRLKLDTLQKIPLFISEVAIITGFLIMLLVGGDNSSVMVGIFAIAAFRLIPAMRGILSCYNTIQNSFPCLDILEDGLNDNEEEIGEETISFNKEISVSDLVFNYGSSPINLGSFCIKKGEYVGFKGYSGIGKTTLFNLILGFLKPMEGEIRIDGKLLEASCRKSWLGHIGYVPQEIYIFNGTIAENVALCNDVPSKEKVLDMLEKVKLKDWVLSLPGGLDTRLGEGGSTLSGGQKQRIAIARALYKGASLLLLDEATSSVDIATEREINIMLKELKELEPSLTILAIAHRESTLAYCSRIIDLENDGKEIL